MKKSSFIFATSIMTLALIVAIVGVTAAWFGDIFEYSDNKLIPMGCNPLSELLYDTSKNMYEFIGNLPIEYIQKNILREPIVAHEDNGRLLDLQYNFFIQNILK